MSKGGTKLYKSPEEELDELEAEEEAAKPHLERMDLKLFEEEKVNKKIKDKVVKICKWKRRKKKQQFEKLLDNEQFKNMEHRLQEVLPGRENNKRKDKSILILM